MEDAGAVESGVIEHGHAPMDFRDSSRRSRNDAEVAERLVLRELKRSTAGVWYAANARVDRVASRLMLLWH